MATSTTVASAHMSALVVRSGIDEAVDPKSESWLNLVQDSLSDLHHKPQAGSHR
jgi:hypothetical protein